eukprot:CAMPEP_0175992378 /NCGR_PEP_ID=MMETSP0108-20121206/53378_1 /TAXON_ID=195067 ORGANISM="Goniomonas pacifica, Strain CCMP1869" /NCGR_SAMPLE_ID=MMETSP0108 /ASSEMBLY_ACC=CAM_ASM_000204 /LENGTH=54 /DNA_ID=CAMNT_0017324053 /DNA_START=14 /DNA_END=178 /DNA_ORIENTATION=-
MGGDDGSTAGVGTEGLAGGASNGGSCTNLRRGLSPRTGSVKVAAVIDGPGAFKL